MLQHTKDESIVYNSETKQNSKEIIPESLRQAVLAREQLDASIEQLVASFGKDITRALLKAARSDTPALSLAEISNYHPTLAKRSLQRLLNEAADNTVIEVIGRGRATQYRIHPKIDVSAKKTAAKQQAFAWSKTSQDCIDQIRQPLSKRKKVSYQQNFLEAYTPNQSSYLGEDTAEMLAQMGTANLADTDAHTLAGTLAKDVLNRLLIDLSWASSKLEGNTYSLLDTQRLLELGERVDGLDDINSQMILNHKVAIEYLLVRCKTNDLSTQSLGAIHALLSDGLLKDPRDGGRVRSKAVEIGASVYLPIALPARLEGLWHFIIEMATEIKQPIERAFFLMVHIPYLQPFIDVNKRTSRLAANLPLIAANLCPLSFIDVPIKAYTEATIALYERTDITPLRELFIWAYERSCQTYAAVKQQLAAPDTFRLQYRHEVTQVVAAKVRGQRSTTPKSVALVDRERFVVLIAKELRFVTPENAVRYGLQPIEVAQWLTHDGTAIRDPK
jgi:Fic/DOC family